MVVNVRMIPQRRSAWYSASCGRIRRRIKRVWIVNAIGPAHYCSTREQTRRGLPRECTHNPGSAHFVPSTLVSFLSVEQTAFHSFFPSAPFAPPHGIFNDPLVCLSSRVSWPLHSFRFCSPVSPPPFVSPPHTPKHTLSSLTTSEWALNYGCMPQLIVVQVRTRNGVSIPRRIQRPCSSLHYSLNSF